MTYKFSAWRIETYWRSEEKWCYTNENYTI